MILEREHILDPKLGKYTLVFKKQNKLLRALKHQSDHLLTKENTQAQAHHPRPPLPSR